MLLPVVHLVLVANLADVGDVGEQVVQRFLVEGPSAASGALPRRPAFGSPAPAVEFLHDRQQRLPLQVHLKDLADAIGFGLVHDELRVDHRVPQDRHPARPLALATGGRDLVPGLYALQKALRKRIDEGLDWLTIKSLPVSRDAIPWFWNWSDRRYAAWWDSQGLPFVQGPNMLFLNSATPRIDAEECALLDAASCRAMFCHSEWYRDLIARHRGAANQSPIIMWPYPIDPWPGGPLPDEYDLLIYAKNGHRPMLLEHLAELFPRHIQIHYGQYHREQLFEAARRSRACAYLADDDHGPLALQEILLAGCPTVGVRTGASFVKSGKTGVLVDRLPPGRQCVETDEDERALADYLDAVEQAQAMDRESVRQLSAEQFDTERIIEIVIAVLATVRESTLSDRSMEIDTICKTLRISRSTFYRYVRL